MKKIHLFPLVIAATLYVGNPVFASSVGTSAEINFGTIKYLDNNTTSYGASSSEVRHGNNNPNYYSRSYSDQTGKIATSARIDYNYSYDNFSENFPEEPHVNVSTAKWSDNFIGTGSDQFLTFNIDKGMLAKTSIYGEEQIVAGYGINIMLDGNSIWSSHDEMGWASDRYLNSGRLGEIRNKVNAYEDNKLLFSKSRSDDNYNLYTRLYNPFEDTLSLGSFVSGESFEVSYEMTTYVFSAYFIGNDYGMAAFGDPLNVSGSGMQATVSSVPVPAAAYLFATGLLGMVGIGRRR